MNNLVTIANLVTRQNNLISDLIHAYQALRIQDYKLNIYRTKLDWNYTYKVSFYFV